MNKAIRIIGVPIDLGQNKRGVDMGLAALRYAGFTENNFVNALIPLVGAVSWKLLSAIFAERFDVRGIPVVLLLRNGRIVDQLAGAQTAEAVLAWCKRQL